MPAGFVEYMSCIKQVHDGHWHDDDITSLPRYLCVAVAAGSDASGAC